MKRNAATIHATLAIGSVATTPYYDVQIAQTLCSQACVDETPVFAPQFSVSSVQIVGTDQYLVVVHCEGLISFMPCGCSCCGTRSQMVSQDFAIPVYSTTAISGASITAGVTINQVVKTPCCNCSKDFVSDTPITLNLQST